MVIPACPHLISSQLCQLSFGQGPFSLIRMKKSHFGIASKVDSTISLLFRITGQYAKAHIHSWWKRLLWQGLDTKTWLRFGKRCDLWFSGWKSCVWLSTRPLLRTQMYLSVFILSETDGYDFTYHCAPVLHAKGFNFCAWTCYKSRGQNYDTW